MDNSIIPVYDIEEQDLRKFKQLIETIINIQDIELTHESTTKEKHFIITTNIDYKKVTIEAKDIIKYVYPNRTSIYIQY